MIFTDAFAARTFAGGLALAAPAPLTHLDPPSEIIAEAIVGLGLAEWEVVTWQAFVSFLPDKPDEAICAYDTAGRFDGRIMRTGEKVEHPGVQIRVRARDYVTAWRKATTIARALDTQAPGISVVLESGDAYVLDNVSRDGPIIPLGVDPQDSKRRYHFTINMTTTIRNLL